MSRFSNDPLLLLEMASSHVQEIVESKNKIAESVHPLYDKMALRWERWRLAYRADEDFKDEYLERFSRRENNDDFYARKKITYVPPHAQVAVNEVKDAIFQRLITVERNGGPDDYQACIKGEMGGVDLQGSTMNGFIGNEILPELLPMGKVGIYVDRAPIVGTTLAEAQTSHPYLYIFRTEDIRNWVWQSTGSVNQLQAVLLREIQHKIDKVTGLPDGTEYRYRYMFLMDGGVGVQYFDEDSLPLGPVTVLDLPQIPLVILELQPTSLMSNVADYQIALMNLESSDLALALKSNVPIYVEQFNPAVESPFLRNPGHEKLTGTTVAQAGEAKDARSAKPNEVEFGIGAARRYPQGLEAPSFINPSAEPLMASMQKGDKIKADIRMNVKLAVQSLAPQRASSESKAADDRTLEAGLSAIGLILEQGERQIAKYWEAYGEEKAKTTYTVRYPSRYNLKDDSDLQDEADKLAESISTVPSLTYKKEAMKRIVDNRIGFKVSTDTLNKINKEIDQAEIFISKPEELKNDIELGILSLESAAEAKNYPPDEVKQAAQDHAERVKRIVESQASARGVPDMGGLSRAPVEEKRPVTTSAAAEKAK